MSREFRYIAGLDPLRFLGASSVIALHLGSAALFKEAGLADYHVLVSGGTGVNLFYVISGFLITSLISEEVRQSGAFDLKGFFLRRALRIFPLYYFVLGSYLLVHLLGLQKLGHTSFTFAALYSYNFIPSRFYDGWLGSFHTLATEEHFYLVYPLIWALCLWRRLPIWIALVTLILLTHITLPLCRPLQADFFVGRWTFNAWGPILIGCVFARINVAGQGIHEGRKYFLLVFGLLFGSQVLASNALTVSIAFGFLILHLSFNQHSQFIAAMRAPAVRYLGSISYGMYVWQSFIISTGPSRRLITNPVLAVVVVLLLSALSWHYVERPIARIRDRIRSRASAVSETMVVEP